MEIFGNDITLVILIALMASAFAAGFIDSVAGGGGLILVPSFILAGLPPQLALAKKKLSAHSARLPPSEILFVIRKSFGPL